MKKQGIHTSAMGFFLLFSLQLAVGFICSLVMFPSAHAQSKQQHAQHHCCTEQGQAYTQLAKILADNVEHAAQPQCTVPTHLFAQEQMEHTAYTLYDTASLYKGAFHRVIPDIRVAIQSFQV
ncbi:hypothetical protein LX64_02376 [Chitinophaga skermanii]|uniref:Uncharacterized protein n=1 Tax=Chitinophaga skermanii TaxID=331697 RepID=A0A327QLM1_9BACT|nr:hypothetical protein [Chitinophaga skermanii]RAJ05221.1 hypothetical protein LX64_02376 [Chitinophaga skermanii]